MCPLSVCTSHCKDLKFGAKSYCCISSLTLESDLRLFSKYFNFSKIPKMLGGTVITPFREFPKYGEISFNGLELQHTYSKRKR